MSSDGQLLAFVGSSVHFPPERAELLVRLQSLEGRIESVDSLWLHLIQPNSPESKRSLEDPASDHARKLADILEYGDQHSLPNTYERAVAAISAQPQLDFGSVLFIRPRKGTLSPWASKATDIVATCGLKASVKRLERCQIIVLTTTNGPLTKAEIAQVAPILHDRMTEEIVEHMDLTLDASSEPRPVKEIDIGLVGDGVPDLHAASATLFKWNKYLGLALTHGEIEFLIADFAKSRRNPTDAELFMFAQVNSEHCRHKIFNSEWTIDGSKEEMSLFNMIRNTHKITPDNTLSAYSDNAAVVKGPISSRFLPAADKTYVAVHEHVPLVIKVETHNHPTAVSPYQGASTGSGGEIRDEGAVGRGGKPKAGLSGFSVSNLLIPGFRQAWEEDFGKPLHISSSLDIMLQAPLGAAAFNNEFGRPGLCGYFRTYAQKNHSQSDNEIRGYHKPIMIAGGLGNVRPQLIFKNTIQPKAPLLVLGGPGLLIGLGGGAASSLASGSSTVALDFASVQRENPEMQRRCQQVIDACCDLGERSPIASIHDVGAGGLSNALPEIVHDSSLGACIEIRDVLIDDSSMRPMEIWCNESQERYVIALSTDSEALTQFQTIANRERCPYSVVGYATSEERLVVTDRLFANKPIDISMATLFGKSLRMHREVTRVSKQASAGTFGYKVPTPADLDHAVNGVLHLPSVGSKSFLITIGDRSVGGLVARDQMVGPWQVPVADVAVTKTTYGFDVLTGEAMAMGERTPLAVSSAPASARIAVAEALTNLLAAGVVDLKHVKLSANWMCSTSHKNDGADLFDAVRAVGMEMCPALGLSIPVGKDSMSMKMHWKGESNDCEIVSPVSLIVSAFSQVTKPSKTWTPQLQSLENTSLLLIECNPNQHRLGCSALAQVSGMDGGRVPDVDQVSLFKSLIVGCTLLHQDPRDLILAYHDRSDGGLFTTVVEMCFAGRCGVDLHCTAPAGSLFPWLFAEEVGIVVQCRNEHVAEVKNVFQGAGLPTECIQAIGRVNATDTVNVSADTTFTWSRSRASLQQIWAETSYRMQSLRDDVDCAKDEFDDILAATDPGLQYKLSFAPGPTVGNPTRALSKPRVAILREQGVNGHTEMAWAFAAAGFSAVDVHMSDIKSGNISLSDFRGIAACGGFSYGDVLGAGSGWAKSILHDSSTRSEFKTFFERQDTFALGVCNGCQMFSHLRDIIPGASNWPEFKRNKSRRFEARVCMVEVVPSDETSKSVFLKDMAGSYLPVAVAHAEGRAVLRANDSPSVIVRYVNRIGLEPTVRYPHNPNGSPDGITGVQAAGGRVLALMPHPERVVAVDTNSFFHKDLSQSSKNVGPWFRMFQTVHAWCWM